MAGNILGLEKGLMSSDAGWGSMILMERRELYAVPAGCQVRQVRLQLASLAFPLKCWDFIIILVKLAMLIVTLVSCLTLIFFVSLKTFVLD